MKKKSLYTLLIIVGLSVPALSGQLNDLPPYKEPITIEHCDRIFSQLKKHNYFEKLDPDIPGAGRYSYCFSIGWPQLPHLIQAGILWDRDLLYLTWWQSERRDTRLIVSALLLTLDRVDVDIFHPPNLNRFSELEKQLRSQENDFVINNLKYFYDQFLPIFKRVLGEEHSLVKILKNKYNLNSQYIKQRRKP